MTGGAGHLDGGDGGDLGEDGEPGTGLPNPSIGGTRGRAVRGVSLVTWIVQGDTRGRLTD